MAAPRNPFGGVLGGRPRITGETPFGGGRGKGFSRQNRLDVERAIRDAQQVLRTQRAVEAKRVLAERGKNVDRRTQQTQDQLLVTRKFGIEKPRPLGKVEERLMDERARPLQIQRRKALLLERRLERAETRRKAVTSLPPEPDEQGNVSLRLLKERTQPLRKARTVGKRDQLLKDIAAKEKSLGKEMAKGFKPLRMTPEQVEATVESFARPVTAQDVRRGGFQAVTPESAPAQELEARLAQVGTRTRTMDVKLGEPIGFERTEFKFTQGEGGTPGTLIGMLTEIPANNPARKMVLVSLRSEGVPGAEGKPIVFLVPNRISALGVIDQVREDFHGLPLPRLEIPQDREFFIPPRQVFPKPPIAFERLEKNRIVELEGRSVMGKKQFALNPSLRTALRLMGPTSRTLGTGEVPGALRGFVRENGDVVLFPVDLFHEEAINILGLRAGFLASGGEAQPHKFILEQTRQKGFEPFFDNPVAGRRILRENRAFRRLFRADQLPKMVRGATFRTGTSPRPTSPATTPKEPIL